MNAKALRIIIPLGIVFVGLFIAYNAITNSPSKTETSPTNLPASTIADATESTADQPVDDPQSNENDDPNHVASNQPAESEDDSVDDTDDVETQTPIDDAAKLVDSTTDDIAPQIGPLDEANKENGAAYQIPATPVSGYHFQIQPEQDGTFGPFGEDGDAEANPSRIIIDLSDRGAGIGQATLLDHFKTTDHVAENRYTLFNGMPESRPVLGMRAITINGVRLDASGVYDGFQNFLSPVWRENADVATATSRSFEASVLDANQQPVVSIARTITLGPGMGQITVEQHLTNLTNAPIRVQVEQWGPADLPPKKTYIGDFRRFRFGYTESGAPSHVAAGDSAYLAKRDGVVADGIEASSNEIWPNETSREEDYTLAWLSTTNRYFAFAVYPHFKNVTTANDKSFKSVERVDFFLDSSAPSLDQINTDDVTKIYCSTKMISPEWTLDPNASKVFSLGAYAGAQTPPMFSKTEPYRSLDFKELVIYQLSCAFCTFQWLAKSLIWFLRLIQGSVLGFGVGDWAISIIILVLAVRGVLHPLTKRGQISMQKMQKKMAKVQPEVKKLQEKYKDNSKKLQQEQMKLYKEHDVQFTGCLGMAPMFLQMPIWVALYAVLYFAIELRHEEAFYGIFQLANGWSFLADLSEPDKFINFGGPISFLKNIPLLKSVESINLLPILMGVVFFLQQKYMTPQNPNMTPEQEQQQKIMKIIFPLMFPIMLYPAPAGLTLYIMTSSTVGIIESKYIRAHVSAMDLENQPKKEPGFIGKWMRKQQERVAHAQATMDQQQGAKGGGGAKRKKVKNAGGRNTKSKYDRKPKN